MRRVCARPGAQALTSMAASLANGLLFGFDLERDAVYEGEVGGIKVGEQ